MFKVNRIFISCDDQTEYKQFIPIVSLAWQKLLGIKPTLAYVTDTVESTWDWMKEYCADIVKFPVRKDLKNNCVRAYCARMIIRYKYPEDICMVSDLDMIPLNKEYFNNLPENYSLDKFVNLTYDAFLNGDGDAINLTYPLSMRKFPTCYSIATGKIWKEIINPEDLDDDLVIDSWNGLNVYDPKENINAPYFCDESLMRMLIQRWNPSRDKLIGIDRGLEGGRVARRLDRSSWFIDEYKLQNNFYIDAHCPKPILQYQDDMKKLTNYLGIPFILKENI